MCLFRKKKTADKILVDKDLIEMNSKNVKSLIVLAKDKLEIVNLLGEVQEQLKYLIPSNDSKVIEYDGSIKNKICDLRIALKMYDGNNDKKVMDLITNIRLAIEDRNANL